MKLWNWKTLTLLLGLVAVPSVAYAASTGAFGGCCPDGPCCPGPCCDD